MYCLCRILKPKNVIETGVAYGISTSYILQALKDGAEIIASVDDDNIPLDIWGQNIMIGKPTNVYYYETDEIAFDAIGVTNSVPTSSSNCSYSRWIKSRINSS